jgi:hypothetical protein
MDQETTGLPGTCISTFPLVNMPPKINTVDSLSRMFHQKPATMPDGYTPLDSDIGCGRGNQNWNMTGYLNFTMSFPP